jgi:integrase
MKQSFESYTLWAFSESELKRLLEACPTTADFIMILLSSRYGFRREDVVKIILNNIDLKNGLLTYHEQKKNRDRTIPIEADVVSELRKHINTLPQTATYLLPFNDGSTAWRHLQEICSIANIPIPTGRTGRPFHSLRGTCVKQRQKQGWSLNEVSALIGDTPQTVALHYATVSPSELKEKMIQTIK